MKQIPEREAQKYQDYQKYLPVYQPRDSYLDVIPECFKNRLKDIQQILKAESAEQLQMHVCDISNGVRIFQPQSNLVTNVQKFYTQYSVELQTDFILQTLRDTTSYKQWCLFLNNSKIEAQIDDNNEMIKIEASLILFFMIQIRIKIQMMRCSFLEQESKNYVIAFTSIAQGCKDVQNVFILIGLNQIYEKTNLTFYVEVTPKKGKIYRRLGHLLGEELIKSFCNFKTFIKQEEIIKNSPFFFQLYEPLDKNIQKVQLEYQKQQLPQAQAQHANRQQQSVSSSYYYSQKQHQPNEFQQSPYKNEEERGQTHSRNKSQRGLNQELFEQTINENQEEEEVKEPEGYQRENTEPVKAEECKTPQGEWTKWVIERFNPQQLELYKELRYQVDEAGYGYLSVNHVARYLKSFEWKVDDAFDKIKSCEEWRKEHGCLEVKESEIDQELNMKCCFVQGHDKIGRSLIFIRSQYYNPSQTNQERVQKFVTHQLDKACAKIQKNADQYIMIIDFNNAGYANFDFKQVSKIAPVISNNYADRLYQMYFIKTSMVLNIMYKMMTPFIHPVTQAKFRFVGKNYQEELLKVIDKSQLPIEYGGEAPSLE